MAVTSAGGGEGESAYGAAKTSVWWDIENCHVPRGSDAHVIAQNISSALADVGYKGAVTISAYGDTNKIPTAVQQALSSTGIALNHVPAGVKDASDKKILVDMLFWAVDNPPPANYLLISGDRDFSNALHQLRMRRYNILLAHAPNVSQALVAAARHAWQWTSLLAGGSPLQNSDSCYPSNAAVGSNICKDASQKTVEDTTPSNGSSATRKEDSSFIGRGDTQYNGNKQVWRNQIQPTGDISRSSSLPENKESHSLQFQKQMSMPVISSSEACGSTQLKHTTISSSCSSTQMPHGESGLSFQSEGKQVHKAPHEFFGANKSRASVGASNQHPYPGGHINSGNNFNKQIQYSQPFRPSGMPPSPTHFPHSHNYGSYLQPHQQSSLPFRPGPPDFNRLKISEFPSNAYQTGSVHPQNSGTPSSYMHTAPPSYHEMAHQPQLNAMSNNISCNGNRDASGFQMPSTTAWDLIRNIQGALNQLKANKMIPTEANISDCIRYGMGIQSFNVNMALNCALEHNVIVMHKLGANLPFYIGKNDKLWRCVNPLDGNVRHPEATWDAIQNFLSSARGQSSMSSTECRYHAAIVLKKSCLDHLALGDVLQILHAIVQVRKWIIPSFHGWQPLFFSLKVASDSSAGVGTSTKVES